MSGHARILRSSTFLALLGAASVALAQQAPPLPPPPPQQRDNSGASEAVRRAERNSRGEVLSVERVQYDGRDMHRVKVVDDHGRVRVYMQDSDRGNSRRRSGSREGSNGNGD